MFFSICAWAVRIRTHWLSNFILYSNVHRPCWSIHIQYWILHYKTQKPYGIKNRKVFYSKAVNAKIYSRMRETKNLCTALAASHPKKDYSWVLSKLVLYFLFNIQYFWRGEWTVHCMLYFLHFPVVYTKRVVFRASCSFIHIFFWRVVENSII